MNSRGGGRVGPEIQLDDPNPTEKGTTSGPEPGRARRDANGDREGWMHKYLFLFYRTWTGLFLASVVCSALAQPHVLDGRERTPSQLVQLFPGQQTLPFEGRPSNVSSAGIACRLHSTPRKSEIRHSEHVDSSPGHSRRTKLRSRRYSRRGDDASNFRPDDDGALATRASPKVSQSGGRSLSRGRTRADVEPSRRRGPQAGDPRDAVILGRLFEHGPKTQRRATHFRQQRDRDVQSDGPSSPPQEDDDEDVGKPCVYSGHLKTDRNWYGYLANVSLAGGSGRLVFEFSYPADACCQSVLFYHEDQLSIMSARTNCWQKEDLLRPDADQILRLTPNFSWSGCQVKKKRPMGDTMVCKGGRSFTRHSYDFHSAASKDRPDADVGYGQRRRGASGHDTASNAAVWYVAVSHCASLKGLDLRYKLKVYGHSVPCPSGHAGDSDVDDDGSSSDREGRGSVKSGKETPSESVRKDVDDSGDSKNAPSSSHSSSSTSYQSHKPSDAAQTHLASDEWPVCTIEGSVNTTHSWFGFIKNLSLVDGGGFRFYFSLPYSMSPMNVLLYHDEDIRKLHWEQICWLKDSVIESKHVLERIIDLTSRSIYNGCASKTGANIEGNNLTCRGEKIFSGDRNIYIALSNCRSREGLLLRYKLEVFGYKDQTLCSGGVGILLRAEAFFTFCGSFFLLKLAPFR